MPEFTLDGVSYEYRMPDAGHPPEAARSWEYGNYPKVVASLPLADSGTVDVYALANRWNPAYVVVTWQDDAGHAHWAWVPAGNVRRVTDSEWDIEEYRRCPEKLRHIQWGNRLPGFLPS